MLSARATQPLSAQALGALRQTEQTRALRAVSQLEAVRAGLGLDNRHGFTLKKAETDAFGMTHVRVQQLFQGVPVWGGQAIVHADPSGTEGDRTDALLRSIELETIPSLEASEALAIAHQDLRPRGPYANPPSVELVIYPILKEEVRPGHGPNINAQDILRTVERYVLAYHVHTELENSLDPIKHTDYLIDARTGSLLKRWDSLQTEGVVGTGNSQFNGSSVPLNTNKLPNGTYEFRDMTRGTLPHPITGEIGNTVRDVNHLTPNDHTTMGTIYTDADNAWGTGENYIEGSGELGTTSPNGQTAAVDGGFGLANTWDYYLKVHGRNGIDGLGRSTLLRMHIGSGFDNAFWSDNCFCMSFGDGTVMSTLTPIDVAGHEMSHGVMSTTASLTYSGESGGLNEANSDIHGTMVEFYSRNPAPGGSTIGNTGGNWTIGEQLYTGGEVLRYMYRPDLDYLSPNYWYPTLGTLDVHNSSGPMNRAFFFLSQGATATGDTSTAINASMEGVTSPNFLPSGMVGIGNEMAAAIWFRAMTAYMTMGTNYLDARHACERAAADLYGPDSTAVAAVQNAFAGINVGAPAGSQADTIPPVVSASVTGSGGTIILTATATDNLGVTRLDFFIDGASVGQGTLSGGVYTLPFDSRRILSGAHSLTAYAYDGAGNVGNSALYAFNTANANLLPIINGDFEQGFAGWLGYRATLSSAVKYGAYSLWMGGIGNASTSAPQAVQAYQDGQVIVPNATSITVDYDVWLETSDTTPANMSALRVAISDSPITSTGYYGVFSHLGVNPIAKAGITPAAEVVTPGAWQHKQYVLNATTYPKFNDLLGQRVSLFINSLERATAPTNWFIDNVTMSIAVPLHADITPPTIGTPTVTVSGTSYAFQVTATDETAMGAVKFYVDGSLVATSLTAPYTAAMEGALLGNGTHKLIAIAYDASGNATPTAEVAFSVLVPVPVEVQLEQESNNTMLTADALLPGKRRIQATLPTMQDVDFFAFTIPPGATLTLDTSGPLGSDYDLTLLNASGNAIKISGNSGCTEHLTYTNAGTSAMPVYARVSPFSVPTALPYFLTPTFSMDSTAPAVTGSVTGTGMNLNLTATAIDAGSGVARVEFYVDALLRGSVTNAPYAIPFDASVLADGVHVLTVTGYDAAGNVGTSAPVNFTTAVAPTAVITTVASAFRGQEGLLASVPIQVGATYNWTLTGGTLTSAATGPQITFTTGTGDTTELSVTVTSATNAIATSTRTIALKVPAVATVSAAITRTGNNLTFHTVSNGPLVQAEYFVDGTSKGVVTSGADFAMDFDATSLAEGFHTLVAKGTDPLGNVGASNAVIFTVASAPLATINAASTATAGSLNQVASAVVHPGATYAWSITGGTLTSPATGSSVTFNVDAGTSLTLALEVTSATGETAKATKVIAIVPINLDVNGDRSVDPMDLAVFAKAVDAQRGDANYNALADLNGDGKVDATDITNFLAGLDQ